MSHFVDIHTHSPLQGGTVGLRSVRLGVEKPPLEGDFSLGIHPWDCLLAEPDLHSLMSTLEGSECRAVGEVGIDKVCSSPMALQREIFEAQVKIAESTRKPLIIHSVRAYNEVALVLRKHNLEAAIFHGFVGSKELLAGLISNSCFVSFGWGAFRSPKTLEALRNCPLENLFLESDTATHPIEELYEKVAELRGITTEELKEKIYNNYKRIFTR